MNAWEMRQNEEGNLQLCSPFYLWKPQRSWRRQERTSGGIMRRNSFLKLMTIGSLSPNKIFLSAQTALICNIFCRYLLISVKNISQKLDPIQQKEGHFRNQRT